MLLASAPLQEWSLLSSRPTSRAHDRSLRQSDPTGRTKLTTHQGQPFLQPPSMVTEPERQSDLTGRTKLTLTEDTLTVIHRRWQ